MLRRLGRRLVLPQHWLNTRVLATQASYVTSAPPTLQDFQDYRAAFEQTSLAHLAGNWAVLGVSALPGAVSLTRSMTNAARGIGLGGPVNTLMRYTSFRVFCGGETFEQVLQRLAELQREHVLAVVNYAVEDEGGTSQALDTNLDNILQTIRECAPRPEVPFACLKPTAVVPASLCTRLAEIIEWHRLYKPDAPLPIPGLESIPLPRHGRAPNLALDASSPPAPLSDVEQQELAQSLARLDTAGGESVKHGMLLLIDAERSWQQPAVDMLYRYVAERYNKHRPVIYNTYQCYMVDAGARIRDELDLCAAAGLNLGAKIVRGAYMNEERKRAQALGIPSPIQPDFEATTTSYHTAIDTLLGNPLSDLFIATHNVHSAMRATQMMADNGVATNAPNVYFAQLLGMADHVTFTLARHGYNVCKYVPFGPVDAVMPYLMRRAEENTDVLGSSSDSRRLMCKELARRVTPGV